MSCDAHHPGHPGHERGNRLLAVKHLSPPLSRGQGRGCPKGNNPRRLTMLSVTSHRAQIDTACNLHSCRYERQRGKSYVSDLDPGLPRAKATLESSQNKEKERKTQMLARFPDSPIPRCKTAPLLAPMAHGVRWADRATRRAPLVPHPE